MSKFSHSVVLITALASLFAVTSSSAGAVTWTNEGATDFSATGDPGTLHVGSNALACTASTATGDAPVGSGITDYKMAGTLHFAPCSLVAQNMYWHCQYSFTATTYFLGVTAGETTVTCDLKLQVNNLGLCHISGTTPTGYTNPSGATPGKITLLRSSSLTVSNFGSTSCPFGTGVGTLTEQTFNLSTAAGSPIITGI